MDRKDLIAVARRMIHHGQTGTTASHPDGPRRNPISTYTDPQQFELERERIFGRFPQLVCFSRDLAQPGDFRTFDAAGVPMLVLRAHDGRARAFLNACAHRSARLVEGSGSGKKNLVCPYHAWAYDLEGRCVGIHQQATFGRVDRGSYRLVELPCEEKYGFIYAAPAPDAHFTIDDHLGDLGRELGTWNLGDATHVKSGEFRVKSNWKLALDTFCESYHFGPLHPTSVGIFSLSNCATYDRYGKHGEHHRLGFPNKAILELASQPEDEWPDPLQLFAFVHYLFPNVSLLVSPDAVELFRLFPGERVGEHVTKYDLYMRQPVESEARLEAARAHFDFIYAVVDREDYWVSANVQRNFNSGLQSHTTFGRNEPALINMHRTFRRMAGLPLVDEPAPEVE